MKTVLYDSLSVDRPVVRRRRRRHAAGRTDSRPAPRYARPTDASLATGHRHRRVPDAGARPGRLAIGRPRSSAGMLLGLDRRGGRGVLLLSGDADDDRGVRPRSARGARSSLRSVARLEIAIGLRDGVRGIRADRQTVSRTSSADRVSRRSPGIASSPAWRSLASMAAAESGRECSGFAAASSPGSS